MATNDLTAQQVRDALDYDPETGVMTWRHRVSCDGKTVPYIGRAAGCPCKSIGGRLLVGFAGGKHLVYRLAWIHFYGAPPIGEIDHIDGDHTNNRIANLRDVPRAINAQNRRRPQSNSSTGVLGVHRHRNKFRARVGVNGKEHYIGLFETLEEASAAYIAAKRKLHEGCTL